MTAPTGDAPAETTPSAGARATSPDGVAPPDAATPSEDSLLVPDTVATSDQPADAQPESDPEDLSNLLVSDEPEQPSPRVRVSSAGRPARVDTKERMRSYYARRYRPEHNPSRVYFGARGAYALSGTGPGIGGGRMGYANVEVGQTWNWIGYAIGPTLYAGGLTFGENGVEKFGGVLVGGGPSVGLGRLALLGRGYFDARVGYNFFYAPVSATRVGMADPPDAAPHGPKIQIDAGLLFHDSERRRFRHGIGASLGWQILVHSFAGEFPVINTFSVGVGYFFG